MTLKCDDYQNVSVYGNRLCISFFVIFYLYAKMDNIWRKEKRAEKAFFRLHLVIIDKNRQYRINF